jgi:hypothetical protein
MRYETRIRKLREVYYIEKSLIKRANKRQKRIRRRAKESTTRTIRN